MNILELEWIMENLDKLSEEERVILNQYGVFKQYQDGELHMKGIEMIGMLGFLRYVYEKYNNEVK